MNETTSVQSRATGVRWLIFGLACAISWLLYLHRYAWGVIKPYLKEEYPDLTDVQLGWLDSLFLLTYGLGQVPTGMAGDYFGPRGVLALIILAWSACVGGLGWAQSLWQFGSIRAAFGLAQAGAYPCLSQVTRSWFPLSVRTTVQGFVATLSGRAGGACAPLLVSSLLIGVMGLSWRAALLVIAVLGLGLGVAVWMLFRNSPRGHPWANEAEIQLIGETPPRPPGAAPPVLRSDAATLLTFGALLVYAFCSTFADQLYVFWIPQFLKNEKGLTDIQMGLFASIPLIGGAIGGSLGGVLNDVLIRWTGSRRLGRAAVALTGKMLAGVFILASLTVADGRLVMLVLFACKFFGDWSLPTQWGAITDISGPAAGTVFGIVNTVGSVAGFLASPTMGWIKQHHGWEALFIVVACIYVMSALCWLLIDSRQQLWREPDAAV